MTGGGRGLDGVGGVSSSSSTTTTSALKQSLRSMHRSYSCSCTSTNKSGRSNHNHHDPSNRGVSFGTVVVRNVVSNVIVGLLLLCCLLNVFWLGGHLSDELQLLQQQQHQQHPNLLLLQHDQRRAEELSIGWKVLANGATSSQQLDSQTKHRDSANQNRHYNLYSGYVLKVVDKGRSLVADDEFDAKDESLSRSSEEWDDQFVPTKEEKDYEKEMLRKQRGELRQQEEEENQKIAEDEANEERDGGDPPDSVAGSGNSVDVDRKESDDESAINESKQRGDDSDEAKIGTSDEETSYDDSPDGDTGGEDTEDGDDDEEEDKSEVEDNDHGGSEKVDIGEVGGELRLDDEAHSGDGENSREDGGKRTEEDSVDGDDEDGHFSNGSAGEEEKDDGKDGSSSTQQDEVQQNASYNASSVIASTSRLLSLLQSAGADLSIVETSKNQTLLEQIPSWDRITSLYYRNTYKNQTNGSKNTNQTKLAAKSQRRASPIVYGLDSCRRYRTIVAPENRFVGVAGLFNTGTNAMYWLLEHNFDEDVVPVRWQVPWGKHRPANVRLTHTAPDGWGMENRTNVLPIVVIKDPFTWMQSMCKSPYEANWTHGNDHCPNLRPYTASKRHNITTSEGIPVAINFDENTTASWESLIHLYNNWYMQYYNATYPRLMVRFEDLLFMPDKLLKVIAQCLVGGETDEDEEHNDGAIHHLLYRKRIELQLGEAKSHGHSSDLIHAIIKYGSGKGRLQNMTSEDIKFAYDQLSSQPLVKAFDYRLPSLRGDNTADS